MTVSFGEKYLKGLGFDNKGIIGLRKERYEKIIKIDKINNKNKGLGYDQ